MTKEADKLARQIEHEAAKLGVFASAYGTMMQAARVIRATPAPSGCDPETRRTFTVPDGFEAVRDAEGRATGEVRRTEGRDPATIEACAKIADRYDGWQAENIAAQIRAFVAPAAQLTEER